MTAHTLSKLQRATTHDLSSPPSIRGDGRSEAVSERCLSKAPNGVEMTLIPGGVLGAPS